MKLLLSECLNRIDAIIYMKYSKNINIRSILNDVRRYVIEFVEDHKKKYDQRTFLIILQYINYLIQELFHPITFNYIDLIIILRFLIIRFEENNLQISDDENINFNKDPKMLLKYLKATEEYDDNDNE